jgi:hypothetical protein
MYIDNVHVVASLQLDSILTNISRCEADVNGILWCLLLQVKD